MAAEPIGDRRVAFAVRFARIEAPQRVDGLRSIVDAWQPSLVIYESADIAAPIAAAAAEVPSANHAFGQPVPEAALRHGAEVIAPLWQAVGLEPDAFAGAYRGSYIDIWPPSLRIDTSPVPARTYRLRPVEAGAPLEAIRERPLLYATLGTAFNDLGTFRLLLDAFGSLDCDVVMTIGRNQSPRDLEPIPRNAQVAQYIPQDEILIDCDAVVAHAGSGSVLSALAHGRPLVLLPRGADQFDNAVACSDMGVAETIMPTEISPERVRSAVDRVLTEASYAEAARSVAADICAMPSAASVADDLASHL
jgi:UDP-N-acetylglucosamine transferase subunit ALG13